MLRLVAVLLGAVALAAANAIDTTYHVPPKQDELQLDPVVKTKVDVPVIRAARHHHQGHGGGFSHAQVVLQHRVPQVPAVIAHAPVVPHNIPHHSGGNYHGGPHKREFFVPSFGGASSHAGASAQSFGYNNPLPIDEYGSHGFGHQTNQGFHGNQGIAQHQGFHGNQGIGHQGFQQGLQSSGHGIQGLGHGIQGIGQGIHGFGAVAAQASAGAAVSGHSGGYNY